jgi:hypothetical protein
MLALFIQAAQQAKQVAPNVYVTVQQPTPGIPEWEKTLITAAVGALVGILSNSFMEFLRPFLARTAARRTIGHQIDAELRNNIGLLESVLGMLYLPPDAVIGGDDGNAYNISQMMAFIKDERYQFYLGTEKLIIYEIDGAKRLESFYEITKRLLPKMAEEAENKTVEPKKVERRIDLKEYQEIKFQIRWAIFQSKWYFEGRKSWIVQTFNRNFSRDPGKLYDDE